MYRDWEFPGTVAKSFFFVFDVSLLGAGINIVFIFFADGEIGITRKKFASSSLQLCYLKYIAGAIENVAPYSSRNFPAFSHHSLLCILLQSGHR
jgi:hypothetical protein